MKQLLKFTALLWCLLLTMSSCSESKLSMAIAVANQKCPTNIGELGEMTSISYEDNVVTLMFTIDDAMMSVSKLATSPEVMKAGAVAFARNPKEEIQMMIKLISEAGADICLVYRGRPSGEEVKSTLSSSDLKEIVYGKDLTYLYFYGDESAKADLASIKLELPDPHK